MKNWTEYALGDVMSKSEDWINVDPDTTYTEVTVRLWGKGVVPRGDKLGSDMGGARRLRVHFNQFIASRIDARHGAFGLIPKELDGAVVSNDFPTYTTNVDLLLPEYLGWLCKTPHFIAECKAASEGTTNRVRIKEDLFKKIKVHLPSATEQESLVKKINGYNSQLQEVFTLRKELIDESKDFLSSIFSDLIRGAKYASMVEVAPIVRRPVTVDFDAAYLEMGVRSHGKGTFHKPALLGAEVGTKKLYYIQRDDLVFSNVFAWESAIAVAQDADHNRVGSHRFICCVPQEEVATSNFLRFYFLSNEGIEKIRDASPGGAGRNRTLGLKKLEKIKVPVPDYDKQVYFDQMQTLVKGITCAQEENQFELESLIPSILDKAFKGKL